jgi:hypothetical protein
VPGPRRKKIKSRRNFIALREEEVAGYYAKITETLIDQEIYFYKPADALICSIRHP